MASPVRRVDSAFQQFRKRVPAAVLARARDRPVLIELPAVGNKPAVTLMPRLRAEVKFSLRTADPTEAKTRMASALASLGRVVDAISRGPVPLPHKQIVALSGEVYRAFIAHFEAEPGEADRWAAFKAFNRAVREGRIGSAPCLTMQDANEIEQAVKQFGRDLTKGINALPEGERVDAAMEFRFGWLTNWVLLKHGLEVDAATRQRLILEVERASTDAAWRLKRAASGDYTPDPKEQRFPPLAASGITMSALFDRWHVETKPAASTLATWRGVFKQFREHLGHDDATRVTTEDVVGFKDALLKAGRAPQTVNEGHLAALRAVFKLAVRNRVLTINPAADVRAARKAVAGTGKLPYTNDEVGRLLALARNEANPARRWLPWLAALTGARVGEVAQLWGANVRREEASGLHVLDIKAAADGGTLKNATSERTVPIHSGLVAEEFLSFVEAKGSGPLFYSRTSGKADRMHASKGVINHLAGWIRRQGFDDPRKAPAHALRHWAKSAMAEAGVPDSVADAIQDHAGRSEADTYRHFALSRLAQGIEAIPVPRGLLNPLAVPAPSNNQSRQVLHP